MKRQKVLPEGLWLLSTPPPPTAPTHDGPYDEEWATRKRNILWLLVAHRYHKAQAHPAFASIPKQIIFIIARLAYGDGPNICPDCHSCVAPNEQLACASCNVQLPCITYSAWHMRQFHITGRADSCTLPYAVAFDSKVASKKPILCERLKCGRLCGDCALFCKESHCSNYVCLKCLDQDVSRGHKPVCEQCLVNEDIILSMSEDLDE